MLPALIAGGVSLLGGLFNSFGQSRQNRLSREWQERMYNRQRDDNLAFWNMQNEYNSPQAQMARFQKAGLNPHMVASQGNPGNAAQIETPSVQRPEFVNPQFGDAISSSAFTTLNAIYDLQMKSAQTDNLKAQNNVILQDAILRGVQIAATEASTARSKFDLDFARDMRGFNAEAMRLGVMKSQQDIAIQANQEMRAAVMQSANLRELSARIESMYVRNQSERLQQANTQEQRKQIIAETARIRKSIQMMSKEGIIKDLDVELAKKNIRPGDPVWYRGMMQAVDALYNFIFEK